MPTLREQIKEKHDEAEKTKFTQLLLSGNIPKEVYAEYLYNQYECYNALEKKATELGILKDFPELLRANLIKQDLEELNEPNLKMYNSTKAYIAFLENDPNLSIDIMGHIYVRHFADMYGGQIIKSKIPGSGKMYEFENRSDLIAKLREVLSEDLGSAANHCFAFVLNLHDEIANEYNL
jgi:heme oxygenase